jgi:hypothetical protein
MAIVRSPISPGSKVDFNDVAVWSHPPIFDWDGEPPEGVVLPKGASHSAS